MPRARRAACRSAEVAGLTWRRADGDDRPQPGARLHPRPRRAAVSRPPPHAERALRPSRHRRAADDARHQPRLPAPLYLLPRQPGRRARQPLSLGRERARRDPRVRRAPRDHELPLPLRSLHAERPLGAPPLRGDPRRRASGSRGPATPGSTPSTPRRSRWMKRAGCWIVAFGVESGDQADARPSREERHRRRSPPRHRALSGGRHQVERLSLDGPAVGHAGVDRGADRVRLRARSRTSSSSSIRIRFPARRCSGNASSSGCSRRARSRRQSYAYPAFATDDAQQDGRSRPTGRRRSGLSTSGRGRSPARCSPPARRTSSATICVSAGRSSASCALPHDSILAVVRVRVLRVPRLVSWSNESSASLGLRGRENRWHADLRSARSRHSSSSP